MWLGNFHSPVNFTLGNADTHFAERSPEQDSAAVIYAKTHLPAMRQRALISLGTQIGLYKDLQELITVDVPDKTAGIVVGGDVCGIL